MIMFKYLDKIGVPFIGYTNNLRDPITGTTAAAISGGSNIVSSIINGVISSKENAKQRNFAREMYAQQMRDTIAQWNRENEYNTPAAQKQRLIEAGLNPNLMMDNGNVGNAQSASIPSANGSYTPLVPHFENPMLDFINAYNAQSQIKKTEAETAKIQNDIQIDTAMLEANLKQMGVDLDTAKQNYWFQSQFMPKQLSEKDVAIKSATLNLDLVQLQKDGQQIMNDLNREELKVRKAHNVYVTERAALEIARERQTLRNLVLQGKLTVASVADMYASAAAHYASADASKAQKESIEYDTNFKRDNKVFFIGSLAQDFLNSGQLNENQKKQLEILTEQANQERYRTGTQETDKWIERASKILGSIVGAVGVGAGAFFGFKKLSAPSAPSGSYSLNGYTPSATDYQFDESAYKDESPYDRLRKRIGKK